VINLIEFHEFFLLKWFSSQKDFSVLQNFEHKFLVKRLQRIG